MRHMPYKNYTFNKMGPRGLIFKLVIACAVLFSIATAARAENSVTILAFGDSLTAGYGLPADQALPARIEALLRDKGHDVTLINAGVSGDTTSGGLARLEWTLEEKPDAAILALGANDMLRAVDPAITDANLRKMMDIFKKHDIPVLVAGMKSLRNLTPLFGDKFQKIYKNVADDYDAEYYPFLLDGVASESHLNLSDGVHPNAAGIDVIAEKILPSVEDLIKRVADKQE